VNHPSPAIVAQHAVRRLPRLALLLFCLAYVLPGFIGRDPWKREDIMAFGFMSSLAELFNGHSAHWLKPLLMGQPDPGAAILPYWLGAWAIQWAPAWLTPDAAVRFPFALLLVMTMAASWYGVYALARSPGAQPIAFAFGGEAKPLDYARAVADGGLLALIASLGLARLAHETTPALAQLSFTALLFFALANLATHRRTALGVVAIALPSLALSGAPSTALLLGAGGALVMASQRQGTQRVRMFDVGLILVMCIVTARLATWLDVWRWRMHLPLLKDFQPMARLFVWFLWPAWPLVLWTLWRWRLQLSQIWKYPHLALPLWFVGVTVCSTALTGLSDRALLLALPAMAALAAFALPTLERSVSALVDWFTLVFFSICALTIWVVWLSMQTGWPAQPAANVARLAPGFTVSFSAPAFAAAVLATLAWMALVQWRAGRHRAALWKSLVLPASGAALCWLLLMTLWLPLLNFGRGYAPLVEKVSTLMGPTTCVHTLRLSLSQSTAFGFHGHYRLVPLDTANAPTCTWLIADSLAIEQQDNISRQTWRLRDTIFRPTDDSEAIMVFERTVP
jgi:4-amino-4-deoxy-L-arabinose transferase-like glycosyltransferase